MDINVFKVINLCFNDWPADGLARAEASRAPYAALVSVFCSCGIYHRLCVGVVPDDDVDLCSWCGVDISAYSSQLAILQSPSPQMVRPKWGWEAPEAAACCFWPEEEDIKKVGFSVCPMLKMTTYILSYDWFKWIFALLVESYGYKSNVPRTCLVHKLYD